MEPTSGSGEVHSHLASHPDKGEGMSGKFDADESAGERIRDLGGRAREGADDFVHSTRDRASELRDRLGGAAQRARGRAGRLIDDAEETIDDKTGVLSSAREYPLAALGVAFGIGFVLAGSGDEERHPSMAKAKNQIKGAIMGGISAAISQQLRTFIEEQGGIGALLGALGAPVSRGTDDEYLAADDYI